MQEDERNFSWLEIYARSKKRQAFLQISIIEKNKR